MKIRPYFFVSVFSLPIVASAVAPIVIWGAFSLLAHIGILAITFHRSDTQEQTNTLQVTLDSSNQASSVLKPQNWPSPTTPPSTISPDSSGPGDSWSDYPNCAGSNQCRTYTDCTPIGGGIGDLVRTLNAYEAAGGPGLYRFYTAESSIAGRGAGSYNSARANNAGECIFGYYSYSISQTEQGPHPTTTGCAEGYTYNETTAECELTDSGVVKWPADQQIAVDRTSNGFECAQKDPDCAQMAEAVTTDGPSDIWFYTASDQSEVTQLHADTSTGETVVTQQSVNPTTQTTDNYKQFTYDGGGNLVGTAAGNGAAPGYRGPGTIGTQGGTSDSASTTVGVDGPVIIDESGTPSEVGPNTLSDTLTSSGVSDLVTGIGSEALDYGPSILDFSFFSLPSGSCTPFSVGPFPEIGTLTFDLTGHSEVQELVGWAFYVLTGWVLFGLLIRPPPSVA